MNSAKTISVLVNIFLPFFFLIMRLRTFCFSCNISAMTSVTNDITVTICNIIHDKYIYTHIAMLQKTMDLQLNLLNLIWVNVCFLARLNLWHLTSVFLRHYEVKCYGSRLDSCDDFMSSQCELVPEEEGAQFASFRVGAWAGWRLWLWNLGHLDSGLKHQDCIVALLSHQHDAWTE